ncbi:hypothetical protein FGG08_007204 [Glutinoglossum americanum]|uniref:Transcription regulator Rua1 C-terminal domain-containing protein n=1 Tax=Glutinoglossum americanum TaxID=1670608 RepID=A0A9P8L170_9PEZI|nr:hypothetical protein FGG08_007204 [Glutinoglossum americanum]
MSHQISYGYNSQRPYRALESLPRYYPAVTMESGEVTSTPQNPMGLGVWPLTPPESDFAASPDDQAVTAMETGFPYSSPEQYQPTSTWGTTNFSLPEYDGLTSQSYSVTGHYINDGQFGQKACGDSVDIQSLDPEMNFLGQGLDEDTILDLRYPLHGVDTETLQLDTNFSRRLSGSSFSVSSVAENPPYEDLSASSCVSDYASRSSTRLSSTLSPVASPRQQSGRGRSSSSPRSNFRAAPYSVDGARGKQWSPESCGSTASHSRSQSEFAYRSQQYYNNQMQALSSRHSSPIVADSGAQRPSMSNFQPQSQHALMSRQHPYGYVSGGSNQPSFQDRRQQFESPAPLLSHGLFRMLQSNADLHSHHHSHYSDMSDPPDLYASLHEEQIPPPPEDMNPSDPDLIPHEQELRFDGDLYTPRWVRGHGNKREGWCGICKPGRWLVLKNSAFWYDKSFTHGISAATGSAFQEPQEVRRMDGNPDVWEGLCGSCNEWVALVSSKKKGTTWFRHAYKCHTHPKVKDAPKRRRESSHTRALAAAKMRSDASTGDSTPQKTTGVSPLETLSMII